MRNLFTTAALAVCCIAGGAALADGAPKGAERGPAGIAEGESLLSARAKPLKQGWRPTKQHAANGYEYSGAELKLTGRKIFEVDSCSMDSQRADSRRSTLAKVHAGEIASSNLKIRCTAGSALEALLSHCRGHKFETCTSHQEYV